MQIHTIPPPEDEDDLSAGIRRAHPSADIGKIRAFVQEKTDELRQVKPERWSRTFFCNFMLNLPGEIGKQQHELFEGAGIMDENLGGNTYESEFKKSKTLRQFYDDIALAVKQNGIDMHRAEELWESTISPMVYIKNDKKGREYGSNRDEHEEELEELFALLQPAYLTLRTMGYNHYDLTGIIL